MPNPSSSTAPPPLIRRSSRLSATLTRSVPQSSAPMFAAPKPKSPSKSKSVITSRPQPSSPVNGPSTRSQLRRNNTSPVKQEPGILSPVGDHSSVPSSAAAGPQTRAQSRRLSLHNVGAAEVAEPSRHVKRPRSQVDVDEQVEQSESMESEKAEKEQDHSVCTPKRLHVDQLRTTEFARPRAPKRQDSALPHDAVPDEPAPKRKRSILKRTKTYPRRLAFSSSAHSSTPAVQFPPTPVTLFKTESDHETTLLLPSRTCDPQLIYKFRRPTAAEEIEKQKQMTQFKRYEMQEAAGNIHAEWPVALPPPDVIRYGDLEHGQQRFGDRFWLNKWAPYAPRMATGVVEVGYAVSGLVEGARGLAGRLVESMRMWRAGL